MTRVFDPISAQLPVAGRTGEAGGVQRPSAWRPLGMRLASPPPAEASEELDSPVWDPGQQIMVMPDGGRVPAVLSMTSTSTSQYVNKLNRRTDTDTDQ